MKKQCIVLGFLLIGLSKVLAQDIPVFVDVFNVKNEIIKGEGNKLFEQFREQNVIVTNSGRIVVVTQARNKSRWSDRSGEDLYCKTSDDHGKTWSKAYFMAGHDKFSIVPNATVYDAKKNRIIVLYNVFTWDYSNATSRKTVKQKNRQYQIHSDDEGLTWSFPKDISFMMKVQNATMIFGSGEGIQLKKGKHKGRLIVPGGDFSVRTKRLYNFYSDDHGDTWKTSEPIPNPNSDFLPVESAIAELKNGDLIWNERSNNGHRRQSYSYDKGETWTPIRLQNQLPSVSCNASIIAAKYKGKDILIYAGPVGPNVNAVDGSEYKGENSSKKRVNGTVFISFDNGKTWPLRKLVVADKFAYSSLVELADGNIGLFYEANSHLDIKMVKFSLDWIFSDMIISISNYENSYNLYHNYPNKRNAKLVYLGENPMNEASVQVFKDGDIRVFHTDQRYSNKVMMQESLDNGHTFSESIEVFKDELISQYPRRTLIDDKGNLHLLVFKKKVLDVYHSVSVDKGNSWSTLTKVTDGRIGAIRGFIQTNTGRLIFAFHRRQVGKKSPTGSCYTSSVFSDDHGKTWNKSASKVIAPVFENYNGNNYGAVEPNIVQLKDGSIKMICRTQTGYLYESTSKDNGVSWSKAKPSVFKSSNSPAHIFRLPNDHLILTWCNTAVSELKTFGRIYTNREVLTMAVSKDEGESWQGFREVFRLPSRNDSGEIPGGDSGAAYPNLDMTKNGKIILVTGQGEHGGGKAMFLIDPTWLEEKMQFDDFSGNLEKWSCYSFTKLGLKPERKLGASIEFDNSAANGKVLLINKDKDDLYADGAVWNFPMGRKGVLTSRIKLNELTKGVSISLTDHFRHPNDKGGDKTAMFTVKFDDAKASKINANEWCLLKMSWDLDLKTCKLYVNDQLVETLNLENETGTGISYVRFRNMASKNDYKDAGLKLDWIDIKVKEY